MDFRELEYVVAISQFQNYTKAAEHLYISQPSLSKYIKNLENKLNIKLFNRLGRKYVLTYAGERYVAKATKILDLKEQLDAELSDIYNLNKGRLRIAFPIMRGTYMLPYIIPKFNKKFPEVNLIVHESNSKVLEGMILDGLTDIALYNLSSVNNNLSYEIISEEEIVLAVPSNHPLAKKGVSIDNCKYPWIDISLFKDDLFIMQFPDQRTRQIADNMFSQAKFFPENTLTIRNIQAAIGLVSVGHGVCLISETHLNHIKFNEMPILFSIGNPKITWEFVAAYRKGTFLPSYAKEFINITKEFYNKSQNES
jgi:DNA-binding transcriptional LysR family regulator